QLGDAARSQFDRLKALGVGRRNLVQVPAGLVLDRVDDGQRFAADPRRADVAYLAAHFAVERRAIEHQEGRVAIADDIRERRANGLRRVDQVSNKQRRLERRRRATLGRRDTDLLLLRRTRAFTLLLHQALERGGVDG